MDGGNLTRSTGSLIPGTRRLSGDVERLWRDVEVLTYFVGEPLASDTLKEVQIAANAIYNRLAPGANNAPSADVLPGIKDAQIQALANAIKLYGDKNAAQGDDQNQATGQLEAIVANIEKLAVLRHQVQLAAEQAFPWRNSGVAAIRQSFLLPVDRPLPG